MSEPITRADYAKWLLSCGDLAMHAMFQDWCAHNPAESASPPRVPGASAHPGRVPFLNAFRTMCLAPEPEFRRVLEEIRELHLVA